MEIFQESYIDNDFDWQWQSLFCTLVSRLASETANGAVILRCLTWWFANTEHSNTDINQTETEIAIVLEKKILTLETKCKWTENTIWSFQ